MSGSDAERQAFALVALPHLDAAFNLARWLLRDRDAAQDCVQDAMLRALTYFASFRGDNPRAWLLRIVRTTAYDRMARSGEFSAEADLSNHADPASDPEAAAAAAEASRSLAALLAKLPVELRECLVLREFEEMSYRDIARITGVPTGTVMSRLWRGRRELIRLGQEVLA